MKQPESIDQTLANIEKMGYMEEQERLISCSRMIMARAGVKFRNWTVQSDDNRFHQVRRNNQVDYIKQSKTISLHPERAEELNLGATAVAIGYCEQWFYSSFLEALVRNPDATSWVIWPLTEGESDLAPYKPEATYIGFYIYDQSELSDELGFGRLDMFASVVSAIEASYGDLKLPRHS